MQDGCEADNVGIRVWWPVDLDQLVYLQHAETWHCIQGHNTLQTLTHHQLTDLIELLVFIIVKKCRLHDKTTR